MPEKFEVYCPCCNAMLVIDPVTEQIVFHQEKTAKSRLSFEAMVSDLDAKKVEREKRFEKEMAGQKDRQKLLDAKFREALERAKDK